MTTNKPSQALILSAPVSDFRDAVILGQGLPLEKDGHPVRYKWKESLPQGTWLDKDKNPFTIDAKRVDNLIGNFNRAKAKGFLPPIVDRHEKRGAASYGFIVDARKNAKGNLELLHQFVGDDAIRAATRNKTSICTVANVTDETGETFDEMIDHQGLVPDPQLNNLEDFQPALAASRGTVANTLVLELAASPTQESIMDLTKLREAIGAGKEITDDKLIEQAVAKLGEGKTATETLSLSRAKIDGFDALKTRAETAERELGEHKTKVLELSRANNPTDPGILADRADLMAQKIDLCLARGHCTEAQANIMLGMLKDGDKPHALMLSRSGMAGTPLDGFLKVLELNKPFTGTVTGLQQIVDPNAVGADAMKLGRDEAADWQAQQQHARGFAVAK